MKIPPRAGMRGLVHYTQSTGAGLPLDGTEVDVIGPGEDELHVWVITREGGEKFQILHWEVNVGL